MKINGVIMYFKLGIMKSDIIFVVLKEF